VKTAQTIITLRQAEALLAFFGGHDSEVAIAPHKNGLIAWGVDYPEEGSAWLGETEVDDELAEKGRDAGAQQAHLAADERDSLASELIQQVAELADRTSPEDDPEAMLANADELRNCLFNALENLGLRIVPAAPTQQEGAR
jgi:hypothetical protein